MKQRQNILVENMLQVNNYYKYLKRSRHFMDFVKII